MENKEEKEGEVLDWTVVSDGMCYLSKFWFLIFFFSFVRRKKCYEDNDNKNKNT